MNTISERLIQLREKNHFSQTDVAKILNATSALISAYEKCERKPSIDKLVQLADIYHTTTDYILGRTSSTDDRILIDVSHLDNKQIQIIRDLVDNMNSH